MAPAERQRHSRGVFASRQRQLLVGLISVTLQNAAVTTQQSLGMMMSAARCIGVDHGGRIAATPAAIIARNGPEVALLGATAPWIEHRHYGFVGEDTTGGEHDLPQACDHGG